MESLQKSHETMFQKNIEGKLEQKELKKTISELQD